MNTLQRMEKMEEILNFILENLDHELTPEKVAEEFAYNPIYFAKIFEEYFEFSFHKYISKLQLRKSIDDFYAHRLVKDIAEKYGYATPGGFSKAFQKEFGMSPNNYIKRGLLRMDMPVKKYLNGRNIFIEYTHLEARTITFYAIERNNPDFLNLFRDIAYIYEHSEKYSFLLDSTGVKTGVWWSDESLKLYYLFHAPVLSRNREMYAPHCMDVELMEDNYAVFHITIRGKEDILECSRALAQYIRREWVVLNQKEINYMGFTYEEFDQNECRIYVPILNGIKTGFTSVLPDGGVNTWIHYIDEHIKEDINVQKLADHFHYSPKHFADIFRLYYGFLPNEYIRKRKLYVMTGELKKGIENTSAIVERYHFKSYSYFEEAFYQEFQVFPDSYASIHLDTPNIDEYYDSNKNSMFIRYLDIDDMRILGKELKTEYDAPETDADLPRLCAFYFLHDFSCLKGTKYASAFETRMDKIGLWSESSSSSEDSAQYSYFLGPVIKKADNRQSAKIPEGMKEISIAGGHYAVFETGEKSDIDSLDEVYYKMTVCVLYGWVHDYRFRVDFNRITFLRFSHGKLYTYVPIYE